MAGSWQGQGRSLTARVWHPLPEILRDLGYYCSLLSAFMFWAIPLR